MSAPHTTRRALRLGVATAVAAVGLGAAAAPAQAYSPGMLPGVPPSKGDPILPYPGLPAPTAGKGKFPHPGLPPTGHVPAAEEVQLIGPAEPFPANELNPPPPANQ